MMSLPSVFEPFKINYNANDQKWDITTLMSKCAQGGERLRSQNPDFANVVRHEGHKGGNKRASRPNKSKKGKKPYEAPQQNDPSAPKKLICYHCDNKSHERKDCPKFKAWCERKGNNDIISIVDESFYAYFPLSTWWIDSGATIHVINSSQGMSGVRTIRKGTRMLRVANGVEADVEAIGALQLELRGGFILPLDDVLYVPSIERNLISVSKLDLDAYSCTFGDSKCVISLNGDIIYRAPLHNDLYLLSHNNISVMNVSELSHKRKRGHETSPKLWHSRLGHISKGRMERLIREEILPRLDFSDLDQCVDCIKGKFAKQIKKDGAKRSSGILELIHTDICGPFNVKSVDGFSYFITFTDDYSRYGYIYRIREKSEALD
ncbi:hypothetical protein C2845_PM12G29900 [Panicum miliaceum]|uniref:CCHC-type domain-containing protein n=1 Tax=Panicum miliaceum TaxID=4540 RepID=A0A3L6QG97_PANMI|nr:hypothetical protein C2845_PM12G29900 [Panicum miliaceum]